MTTRFELVDEGFADPCLTTWPRHHIWSEYFHSIWSGRRGSNSLPPPWQGGALPDELRPHIRCIYPCTLPFFNGAPAKICEANVCGEEEKVWRSSQQSCLQDCTMNSRTFDEATRIGLEPTTPSVTGWCSNQLSYRAISGVIITTPLWSGRRGSNSLPPPWQGGALPDELRPHIGAFTLAPQGKTTRIGLEPTTPSVTGWCSNQLRGMGCLQAETVYADSHYSIDIKDGSNQVYLRKSHLVRKNSKMADDPD